MKLREFEDQLLTELSKVEGKNILENEDMIQTLQNLKTQSSIIKEKMDQSDIVLQEINEVTN